MHQAIQISQIPNASILSIGNEKNQSSEKITVCDKFSGETIQTLKLISEANIKDIEDIIAKAWKKMKAADIHFRRSMLMALYNALESNQSHFIYLIVAEAGKPVQFARKEVERALQTLQLCIDALETQGQFIAVYPESPSHDMDYAYTAAGPVLAITPFNFPLNLALHKIGPAIAAGCPVVIKLPPQAPLSILSLIHLSLKNGLPEGIINAVVCSNEIAEKLVKSDIFKVLSFTGSDKVAWQLKQLANNKKVLLEAGGNAPVVLHDTQDLSSFAHRIAFSAYAYAGQICISAQRLILNEALKENFIPLLIDALNKIRSGNPLDEDCVNGPLIDSKAMEKVQSFVQEAIDNGAQLICGGLPLSESAHLFSPTLIDNVKKGMKIRDMEAFAPVLAIEYYKDFSEAIDLANDSVFGLQAAVITLDKELQDLSFKKLDYGTVLINEMPSFRLDQMPYGGLKQSGIGREGVAFAIKEYCEIKLLIKPKN